MLVHFISLILLNNNVIHSLALNFFTFLAELGTISLPNSFTGGCIGTITINIPLSLVIVIVWIIHNVRWVGLPAWRAHTLLYDIQARELIFCFIFQKWSTWFWDMGYVAFRFKRLNFDTLHKVIVGPFYPSTASQIQIIFRSMTTVQKLVKGWTFTFAIIITNWKW